MMKRYCYDYGVPEVRGHDLRHSGGWKTAGFRVLVRTRPTCHLLGPFGGARGVMTTQMTGTRAAELSITHNSQPKMRPEFDVN